MVFDGAPGPINRAATVWFVANVGVTFVFANCYLTSKDFAILRSGEFFDLFFFGNWIWGSEPAATIIVAPANFAFEVEWVFVPDCYEVADAKSLG